MTDLLPLDPEGEGTGDIESMACFMARLADRHGVNTYQLVNYLRASTGLRAFGDGPVGRCSGRNSLLLSGLGEGARCAIEWLRLGLGDRHWSALTLMLFRDLLPLNGTGVLRPNRAWCPACLIEMRRSRKPEYEKLIWQLRVLTRCPFHRVRLQTACPSCGYAQIDYVLKDDRISLCRSCGIDMLGDLSSMQLLARPAACEADLLAIIGANAQSAGYKIFPSATKAFFFEYVRLADRPHKMRALLTKSGIPERNFRLPNYRPTLDTAINLSMITEVPLRLMLESPAEAARIARLEPCFALKIGPKPRAFGSRLRRQQFEVALDVELAKPEGEMPLSLKGLCRQFDVTYPTAEYWYPVKCSRLIGKYREEISSRRSAMAEKARQALTEFGIPLYRSGKFTSQDQVVDWAHETYGLSKCLLRRELSAGLKIQSSF